MVSVKEEIRNFQFWKAVRTEFLITLLLVFVGCGAAVRWSEASPANDIQVGLAFGLAVATFVQCVGHISGGHMNPAVTLGMLVTRNVSILRAVFYCAVQCLGAIAGSAILYGVLPKDIRADLGTTRVNEQFSLAQAFGVEFMITFIYVFTVFANLDPKRQDMGSRSLAIGLSVTLGHLFAYSYTGASMNPARSLGPALIMNIWENHWLYWVGPMMGGIFGGFTYEYTHDSSNAFQYLRRSFRRKWPTAVQRSRSTLSTNSTEMTMTDDDCRV
ncbi:PREDICTED: aquaporin-4-like [Priapulus caudatus]|uniref:Aquaporin-4-like n=1 Tax=Priapulus caudatus TaxID=37621 RepID=A0ABM1DYW3_PRICU|nr:PREDICTED: aquaporin-4-like [Priapulus caudatus]